MNTNQNQSQTPRTDAAVKRMLQFGLFDKVPVSFARRLECEINSLEEEVDELHQVVFETEKNWKKQWSRQNDEIELLKLKLQEAAK